jgi:hypothetical protein
MSKRYPGGLITKTPVVPTASAAPGIWTLDQQIQAQKAGNWPYGGPFTYIEDVFSTYLYTGNNGTQSIVNGIDLSTNGGLIWNKDRNNAFNNYLADTARGRAQLVSNSSSAQFPTPAVDTDLVSYNTNGFTVGPANQTNINGSGRNYVTWTFRKQPKFFDIVTYTGTGANRTISHNLGSVPGCIIVKRTDATADWAVYHTSLANTEYLVLNSDAAKATGATWWNSTTPTSSVFSLGTASSVNASGGTYVAYLFANNAGGFGLTGTDDVITCGTFTTDGSGNVGTVNLGYEPQWILIKAIPTATNWLLFDNMRGLSLTEQAVLRPNTTDAESSLPSSYIYPTATGFAGSGNVFGANRAQIYIAIRRGPMKVPTVGTTVFSPIISSAATGTALTTNFPVDLQIAAFRGTYVYNSTANDRLRGVSTNATTTASRGLITSSTNAEGGASVSSLNWSNVGTTVPGELSGASSIYWNFQRAPGFFDEVCYTGTGNVGADATRITHNLGVAPELIIVKGRTNTVGWPVYSQTTGVNSYLLVNTTDATASLTGIWATTAPTTTTFGVSNGGGSFNNGGGVTYVAYLFATCAGVSKVGSYTGTGATQTINCGFTGGARFVLIKRTDSTGDWYVWDTARGMVAGTDPSLLLNTTAAEVNANSVYTTGVGFQIVSTAAGINASGGTYIFLAVA